MDWGTWEPSYRAILKEFRWTEEDDAASADALRAMLPHRDAYRYVGTELKHRPLATIVGCGPTLDTLQASELDGIVVAADGACSRLKEIGVIPRIVVTDLDGDPAGLRWAAENGSSMVVHAHGANQDALPLVADLGPFVAGSYQSTPRDALAPMRNLGGFTDGDRAVALCEEYGVREARLVAFDFEAEPSKHTGSWNPATKQAKLAWARRFIDDVVARGAMRVTGLP